MTPLQILSIGIVGFSLGSAIHSLISAWARKRWQLLPMLAGLSLLLGLYALVNMLRRGMTDPADAQLIGAWLDIIPFVANILIIFIYNLHAKQSPGKIEWGFTVIFGALTLMALIDPALVAPRRITAMVPVSMGWLGNVYEVKGEPTFLAIVVNLVHFCALSYCSFLAWRARNNNPVRTLLALLLPCMLMLTVGYYVLLQFGVLPLPPIGDLFMLALYITTGMIVFENERTLIQERDSLTAKVDAASGELRFANLQLRATNEQVLAANAQLTAEIHAHEQTEQALREAENKFRALFDNSFQLIGLLDPEGHLIEVNQTALDMIGVEQDVVRGKLFWDCPWWAHSSDAQQKCRETVTSARNGETVRAETTHVDTAGNTHYVDFSIKPIKDHLGQVAFLVPEGRDVTERHLAEEQLRKAFQKIEASEQQLRAANMQMRAANQQLVAGEQQLHASQQQLRAGNQQLSASLAELEISEEKYRSFIEQSAEGILLLNEQGILCEWNKAQETISGYTKEEVVGHPWIDVMQKVTLPEQWTSALAERFQLVQQELLTTGNSSMCGKLLKAQLCRKDGTAVLVEQTIFAIRSVKGFRIGSVNRDVTLQRQAEQALRESEERFRQLADVIEDIFFLYRRDGHTLLYVSPAINRFFNVSIEEITLNPQSLGCFVHPEDVARVRFPSPDILYSEALDEEFRIIPSDNSVKWLRLRTFLIQGDTGAVTGVAGLVTDITDIHNAHEQARLQQEQLIQADKLASLGLMVSGVAHEVNNPNNLIMLNADVMEKMWSDMRPRLTAGVADGTIHTLGGIAGSRAIERFETMLKGISGGARRIQTLVADLKDFARLDGTGVFGPVDLRRIIESATMILQHHVMRATHHFEIQVDPLLPQVCGSSQKLEQVIINLVVNACDALPSPDHHIWLRARPDPQCDEVVLEVEDDGCGILPEIRGKVMDPFFTSKQHVGGTGLGLSVSYGIIRDHKGSIDFVSEVGKGTCFTIRLKAHTPSSPVLQEAKQ